MKSKSSDLPNYLRQLAEIARQSQVTTGVHVVEIRHDDTCAIWKGGACDCNPEIEAPTLPAKN